MKLRNACAGLLMAAPLLSCGDEGLGVADLLVVSSVEVTPSDAEIVLGGNIQLEATPRTSSGIPVPGRGVSWASATTSVVAVTPDGVAQAMKLGGPVRITATVDGVVGEAFVSVNAFPVAGIRLEPPAIRIVVGESTQLTATALDASGDPLPGRVITWQTSNPSVASVTTTGVVTGVAVGGPVTITASVEGKEATSSVSVETRTATRLGITQQPGTAISGEPITPALRVAVQDELGTTVTGATNPVTVALGANPGGATLGGTTTVSAANGIATFSNLTLDRPGTGYTLVATSPGLTQATSVPFNVVSVPAGQLALTIQPPATARSGIAFSRAPVVQLENGNGTPVATAGVEVSVAIATGNGSLGGTLTVNTDATGKATFNWLTITGTVGTYTLRFSSPGLTGVTSSAITLSAGTATTIGIVTQPSPTATSGKAFVQQPVVRLYDSAGNPANANGVTVTASLYTGVGTLGGDPTKSTNSTGTATYTDLKITGAGFYTIRFSATGLTSAVSGVITVIP